MNCPYCNKEAYFWENKIIYWKNYWKSYMCYYCKDCDASVGTHNNTDKPFGFMANKLTRNARHSCHELLDPLWKIKPDWNYNKWSKWKERKKLYMLIANHMWIDFDKMHFWMFNVEECRIAYKFILEYKKNIILNKK